MENSPGQSAGLKCPDCGSHIPTTIEMLLHNAAIFCSNCGLKLTIDRQESKSGLDKLRNLDEALQKANKVKKSFS